MARLTTGLMALVMSLGAGSALADEGPPTFKPSKFSEAPVDITTDAYGAFNGAPDAPQVGDTLADFSLPKARGGTFKLSEALKDGPLLIMFYRGHW
jgi:hypothetical protein